MPAFNARIKPLYNSFALHQNASVIRYFIYIYIYICILYCIIFIQSRIKVTNTTKYLLCLVNKRLNGLKETAALVVVTSTIGIFSHDMYRNGIPRTDNTRRFDWRRALRMERLFNLFRCRERARPPHVVLRKRTEAIDKTLVV